MRRLLFTEPTHEPCCCPHQTERLEEEGERHEAQIAELKAQEKMSVCMLSIKRACVSRLAFHHTYLSFNLRSRFVCSHWHEYNDKQRLLLDFEEGQRKCVFLL